MAIEISENSGRSIFSLEGRELLRIKSVKKSLDEYGERKLPKHFSASWSSSIRNVNFLAVSRAYLLRQLREGFRLSGGRVYLVGEGKVNNNSLEFLMDADLLMEKGLEDYTGIFVATPDVVYQLIAGDGAKTINLISANKNTDLYCHFFQETSDRHLEDDQFREMECLVETFFSRPKI